MNLFSFCIFFRPQRIGKIDWQCITLFKINFTEIICTHMKLLSTVHREQNHY